MESTENLKRMLSGEQPDAVVNGWEPFGTMFDPLAGMLTPARPGICVVDAFGVTMDWQPGQPGVMPVETPDKLVIKDITKWREVVKAPDVANMTFDFSGNHAQMKAIRAEGKLATAFMPVGNFELARNMMGFENFLVNFLLEPEAMQELIDYLFDFRMACLKHYVEDYKPDAMLFHDDWGAKDSLFISPDTWRQFFKAGYSRMYGYLRENGILVLHHADSFLEPIVGDVADTGVSIWQGVLPQNNIPMLQKQLNGRMLLMGGFDMQIIDHADVDEAAVRREVRRACEEYIPGGGFIPSITYGMQGSINKDIDPIIHDEIERYKKAAY